MASTYTDRNGLTKQGSGENASSWGDILNTVIDLTDVSLDGVLEVDVSAADKTLTTFDGAANEARNRVLRVVGDLPANRTITLPDVEKNYFIEVAISGTNNLTIKNVSDSTGVVVSAGSDNVMIVCDGTSTRTLLSPKSETYLDDRFLNEDSNLSDVTNISAGRVNMGLGTSATSKAIANVSATFNIVYPVGSIYTNYNDATNPGTLLGFGTWTEVAEGRVLVGAGTGTDENTVSAAFVATSTGGVYEHILTSAEMMHSHETGAPDRSSTTNNKQITRSAWPWGTSDTSYASYGQGFGAYDNGSVKSMKASPPIAASASNTAHTNIQPYLVAYIWRRTA